MSNLKMGVAAAGFALIAFASPAFAIGSGSDCNGEGGTMVNVKGSDFCLVPIRPEEYKDAIYDGNQLGVVDCPGNKLNDGQYCMYPVSLRGNATSKANEMNAAKTDGATVIQKSMPATDVSATEAAPMTRAEQRAAKKAAKAAEKAAKKAMEAAN